MTQLSWIDVRGRQTRRSRSEVLLRSDLYVGVDSDPVATLTPSSAGLTYRTEFNAPRLEGAARYARLEPARAEAEAAVRAWLGRLTLHDPDLVDGDGI